jgi:hypothetical protein
MRIVPVLLLSLTPLALPACDPTFGRAEFAPPESRWPSTEPSAVMRETPAAPIPPQYCYRTLAATECYLSAQPGRSGFTGVYPIPGQY